MYVIPSEQGVDGGGFGPTNWMIHTLVHLARYNLLIMHFCFLFTRFFCHLHFNNLQIWLILSLADEICFPMSLNLFIPGGVFIFRTKSVQLQQMWQYKLEILEANKVYTAHTTLKIKWKASVRYRTA